jgi:hypothetical protein
MDVLRKALSFALLAVIAVGISSTLAIGARTVFDSEQAVQTANTSDLAR